MAAVLLESRRVAHLSFVASLPGDLPGVFVLLCGRAHQPYPGPSDPAVPDEADVQAVPRPA